MKITTKTTRAEMLDMLNDAEERALGSYHELLEVRGKLNAAIAQMGDNKPWKLVGLALIVGIIHGYIANAVL
jgi:hypothetical protein